MQQGWNECPVVLQKTGVTLASGYVSGKQAAKLGLRVSAFVMTTPFLIAVPPPIKLGGALLLGVGTGVVSYIFLNETYSSFLNSEIDYFRSNESRAMNQEEIN